MKTGWAKLLNAHIKSFTLVEMLVVITIISELEICRSDIK